MRRAAVDERTLFENVLLGFLSRGPAHGYELSLQLGPRSGLGGVCRLGRSQAYALLKSLADQGLARASLEEGSGGPPRRIYSVTPEGRRRFDAWVRQPVGSMRSLRLEFPWKLHFAAGKGVEARNELLGSQRAVLRARLEGTEGGERSAAGLGSCVKALEAKLLRAGLEWIDEVEAGRTGGKEEA